MLNKKNFFLVISLFAASCSSNFSKDSSKNSDTKTDAPETNIVEEIKNKSEEAVIFFDTDSSKLTEAAIATLEKDVLPNLKKTDFSKVRIEGYCDERGSVAYNKKLGKKRANAVKSYLVQNGAKTSKIKVLTYGESNPVDLGHDEKAWAKNRRAIAIFIEK